MMINYKKKIKYIFIFCFLIGEFTLLRTVQSKEVIVYFPRPTDVKKITKEVIKKLFLGELKHVDDGQPLLPVIYSTNVEWGKMLGPVVCRMNFHDYESYWRKKLFSGAGIPPMKVRTEGELIEQLQLSDMIILTDTHLMDQNLQFYHYLKFQYD